MTDGVKICRSVTVCEIIVYLLVIVQNNKNSGFQSNFVFPFAVYHMHRRTRTQEM